MKCSTEKKEELFNMLLPLSEEIKENFRKNMHGFIFKEKSKVDKKTYAYCTCCNKSYSADQLVSFKHNDDVISNCCHKIAIVKDSGRSRKYLSVKDYPAFFQQLTDGTVVLRTFLANIDYSGDYHNTKLNLTEHYRIFFCPDNKVYSFKNECRRFLQTKGWQYEWTSMYDIPKGVLRYPGIGNMYYSWYGGKTEPIYASYFCTDVIGKSEIFRYSEFDTLSNIMNDRIYLDYLTFYTKHPVLTERLVKENLFWILELYFYKELRMNFNFRAKTVQGFIRCSKYELKLLKSKTCSNTITDDDKRKFLEALSNLKEMGLLVTGDLLQYAKKVGEYDLKKINKLKDNNLSKTPLDFVNYFIKFNISINDYCDYYGWLKKFEIPQSKRTLFPKDFQAQHDYFMKLEDESKTKERLKNFSKLEKEFKKTILPMLQTIYCFSDADFIVRPFLDVKEIINEGLIQSICVGGDHYIKEHLSNTGIICCCRRLNEPDIPYCTIEVSNGGAIVQARMRKNSSAPPEVRAFLKKWKEYYTRQKEIVKKANKKKEVA
ncbi:MAG: PcfJ domain-containing protein [Eubacterium sp.]